jgi:hypothetical protein
LIERQGKSVVRLRKDVHANLPAAGQFADIVAQQKTHFVQPWVGRAENVEQSNAVIDDPPQVSAEMFEVCRQGGRSHEPAKWRL